MGTGVIRTQASLFLFAVLLALTHIAVPAAASEIEMQTRPPVVFANATATDYRGDWLAAISANAIPPTGYCDTPLSVFREVSNHAQLGSLQSCGASATSNISFHFAVQLTVSKYLSGIWNFRINNDFGFGGAVFLDGAPIDFKPFNLDGGPGTIFYEALNLAAGSPVIEIYGQENCCDGFHNGDYLLLGSSQPLSVTDVFSPAFVAALDVSLSSSFSTNSGVVSAANALTDRMQQSAFTISEWYSCGGAEKRASLCVYGRGGVDEDGDAPSVGAGVLLETAGGWRVAAGADFARYSADAGYLGSEERDDIVGGSASVGYAPQASGIRIRAAGLVAHHDIETTRNYIVFAPEQSLGRTNGWSKSVLASIGWGFEVTPRATLAPFGSYSIVDLTLDGYAENGGLLATRFERFELRDEIGRAGADFDFAASDSIRIFAKAALAHRFDAQGITLRGRIAAFDAFSLPLPLRSENWIDGAIGVGCDLTEAIHLNGILSGSSDATVSGAVVGNLGLTVRL